MTKSSSLSTKRQAGWLQATQERLQFTSSVISSMRGVKMLGLVGKIHDRITSLRDKELKASKHFFLGVAVNATLSMFSGFGAKWITYFVFGIIILIKSKINNNGRTDLNVNVLFTSLAVVNILVDRLWSIMNFVPVVKQSLGCIKRIEDFLSIETRRDSRLFRDDDSGLPTSSVLSPNEASQEMVTLRNHTISDVVSLSEVDAGWTSGCSVIKNINLQIRSGSLNMILGP